MISIGSKIFTEAEYGAAGRLGAIVTNREGHLLGLTARDVLIPDPDLFLKEKDNDPICIGERTKRYSRNAAQPAASAFLLGWFAIDKMMHISDHSAIVYNGFVDDPYELRYLGKQVDCYIGGEWNAQGSILSTFRTSKTIDEKTGNRIEIHGLLEVKPKTFPAAWLNEGCAGTSVRLDDGRLLGLIVGRSSNETCYLAPVADIFRWEDFSLPTFEIIEKHNSRHLDSFYYDAADHFLSELVSSPNKWFEICKETRVEMSKLFTEINHLFGRERMIELQDDLVSELFYIVGPKSIAEHLDRLMIHNDAPGENANENWIWRGLFERLRLLRISPDFKSISSFDEPTRMYPINVRSTASIEDVFAAVKPKLKSSKPKTENVDSLLGPDAVYSDVL